MNRTSGRVFIAAGDNHSPPLAISGTGSEGKPSNGVTDRITKPYKLQNCIRNLKGQICPELGFNLELVGGTVTGQSLFPCGKTWPLNLENR